ncbi:peptide-methionine (R)-S-oxide reductase MsrB [Phenylobacterium sp.]|uniref:peptide-methionine (R)-S-oxide reductase MsrB n=1 Tax=Phenylobacterium sp. TaxID=1871053 RepID=UPI0035B143FD
METLDRRRFLLMSALACAAPAAPALAANDRYAASPYRRLTDADWKRRLSPDAYRVLRHEATERPGSSPLNHEKRRGTFHCAGCGLAMFKSDFKFESGTGWPSFFRVLPGAIGTKVDNTLGMRRTEYHCAQCLGHHGHLFPDGPKPTGLRYCNNGLALTFRPA